ncbi:MAG: hypothetical protein BECKG1743E_GA0114224_1002211 [Candidatus Kentron sp. G]|nr:MAG: hypothetical protein BECKG1743E_GA0114224_1002211 [Candidatus Kentron sp. G]
MQHSDALEVSLDFLVPTRRRGNPLVARLRH